MNFKRFHESNNLLNFDDLKNAQSGTIYTMGGTGYSVPHLLTLDLKPNTTYTLSSNYVRTSSNLNVVYFQYADIEYAVSSNNSPSFTTTTGIVKIGFFDTRTGADEFLSGTAVLMLNEGSTPLPYEPYSSEVWHDVPYYIHNTSTDTITTLPADIYADGNNATVGLVGNMQQTGTPTPQNPIQPQGTGERTGNLCPMIFSHTGVVDDAGAIGSYNTRLWSNKIPVSASQSYYVVIDGTASNDEELNLNRVIQYDANGVFISRINVVNSTSTSFTTSANCRYVVLDIRTRTLTVNISVSDINTLMLNSGSTPLPYEPYGYKIPILNNSQTTNVYLGEVETTRKIKKLVLTGEETWVKSLTRDGGFYCLWNNLGGIQYYQFYCDRCEYVDDVDYYVYGTCFSDTALNLWIGNAGWTVNNFKSYLAQQYAAGTPVTVWYVLATEETGMVNEPLRKIGDYADTVSGITIPTITGADRFDVETTLKPSEVTATYKGWHRTELKKYVGGAVNKFNKDATDARNGYLNDRFLLDDNTISTSSLWAVSEYIDISDISTLSAKGANSTSTRTAICYYDDNKTFISGTSYNGTSTQTFTVPSNAKYCRMSYIKPGSNAMLVEGSTAPSEYHPYYEWVDD